MILKKIADIFTKLFPRKNINTRTFTFYIPAPPSRPNGYQEKEFDKIMHRFLKAGHKLISINTSTLSNGMWVICIFEMSGNKEDFLEHQPTINENNQKEIILDEEFTVVHD